MTKNEFNKISTEKDFETAVGNLYMEYLYRSNNKIIDREEAKNRLINKIEENKFNTALLYFNELNPSVNYYRINSLEELTAIRSYADIEDLLEEDEESLTTERVRKFIEENYIGINELFDDEHIIEYVSDNMDIREVYDADTIMDWIKEQYDIMDLIDIDVRWI